MVAEYYYKEYEKVYEDFIAKHEFELYMRINFKYRVEDAKAQVEDVLNAELSCEEEYELLAERFINDHDCNCADNDIWRFIIEDELAAGNIHISKHFGEENVDEE